MNSRLFSTSPFLVLFLIIILVFIEIPVSLCFYNWYSSCSNQFSCGEINVDFPFWGDDRPAGCGYPQLNLSCPGSHGLTTIEIMGVTYNVLKIDFSDQSLKIVRKDYADEICSPKFVNTTLDFKLFEYGFGYTNITLFYGCPLGLQAIPTQFSCDIEGFTNKGGYIGSGAVGPGLCNVSVVVPIPSPNPLDLLNWMKNKIEEVIKEGFVVKWKVDTAACTACKESKGVCGYDLAMNQTTCYCADQTSVPDKCPPSPQAPQTPPGTQGPREKSVSLVIGLAIGGTGIVGLLLGFWIYSCVQRRKKKLAENSKSKDLPTPPSSKGAPVSSTNFSQTAPSFLSSRSDLEKGSTYFGVHVFSYAELEEATANFDPSRELGDGGFGTVYYGKLHDGRVVAVKRLYENNFKRVEQFMNEVEILTRLRHENLVTLYGCTSKRSRELLLVYEYISNGTVADHLNGKLSNSGLLTWSVRLSIAKESADALAYLHKSDVIHRDVKTNNILLDEKFRVKVADFGLSRLFPTDVTHVSTAPQGTPGYVDPEYYQCYQLTDKSDVYSFGVVLIELISSLPAVDTNRHRHNINLANMAINKIQNHTLHELVDPSLEFEKDYAVRRMTTSVAELAFRCLQQERDMRPSMDEVVRILTEIQNEDVGAQKAEVIDIKADDVGLLKNIPLSFSPDSVVTDKWVSSSTTPSSF